MLLCVPTAGSEGLDDQVGEHFGRVPTYTIVDSETREVKIIENTSKHKGGSGLPANLLAEEGIDVMICSGLGRRAINLLDQHDIEVCTGGSGTARAAINQWEQGELSPASQADACTKHQFSDRPE